MGKGSLTEGDTRKETERHREWIGGKGMDSRIKAVCPGAKVQKREGTDGS